VLQKKNDLSLCHLMDLNKVETPVLKWRTPTQSIAWVWIVQGSCIKREHNQVVPQDFGPGVSDLQSRLILRAQSTRKSAWESTFLNAPRSRGHSVSHHRSRSTIPLCSLQCQIATVSFEWETKRNFEMDGQNNSNSPYLRGRFLDLGWDFAGGLISKKN
jgi:hypothetical protein